MTDKKTQLESAATDAIQRRGLNSLSFRTLANEVGIKSASVHYYYPSKSDLANSLIKSFTAEFSSTISEVAKTKRTLKSKLEAFIGLFENMIQDDKFCFCGMMAAEVESLDEDGKKLLMGYFELAENWLVDVIRENQGQVTANIKPEKLAMIIMSGLEGAILIDRVDGGVSHLRAQRELIRGFVK